MFLLSVNHINERILSTMELVSINFLIFHMEYKLM